MLRKYIVLVTAILLTSAIQAQRDSIPVRVYPPINENNLIETKWRYTYTAHAETNTLVHKADASYAYYLHLRHDYTFEHYLNGRKASGPWVLNEAQNEIFYKFRNIRWWRIAELSERTLVLEFSLGKASYQYHYVKVRDEDAPFVKRANELPDIDVVSMDKAIAEAQVEAIKENDRRRREERREKRRARRKAKREKKEVKREDRFERRYKPEEADTFIEIAVIGGGFYGGLDPVIKDFTILRNSGKLVKEYETVNNGLVKTTKDVNREDMERLIKFIVNKKFFDYEKIYDCTNSDCAKRKGAKPTPIPLRVSVQYGSLRKVVTVSMWGYDDKRIKYVDYPEDLDLIVDGIQKLVGMGE